jgi:hypothetical protein
MTSLSRSRPGKRIPEDLTFTRRLQPLDRKARWLEKRRDAMDNKRFFNIYLTVLATL